MGQQLQSQTATEGVWVLSGVMFFCLLSLGVAGRMQG